MGREAASRLRRLGPGDAQGAGTGGLAGQGSLVDPRRSDDVLDAEAGEQLAPARRRRGEDEGQDRGSFRPREADADHRAVAVEHFDLGARRDGALVDALGGQEDRLIALLDPDLAIAAGDDLPHHRRSPRTQCRRTSGAHQTMAANTAPAATAAARVRGERASSVLPRSPARPEPRRGRARAEREERALQVGVGEDEVVAGERTEVADQPVTAVRTTPTMKTAR